MAKQDRKNIIATSDVSKDIPSFCPDGYLPVVMVGLQVKEWFEQKLLKNKDLSDKFYFLDKFERKLVCVTNYQTIRKYIYDNTIRGAAIVKNSGKLMVFYPQNWRRSDANYYSDRNITVLEGSCVDYEVSLQVGMFEETCYPVVSLHDLAVLLGHDNPPPEPSELPRGWINRNKPVIQTDITSDASKYAASWMLGYAEGFKANGRKPKRAAAITAAMQSIKCNYREAGDAFKALPHPDLRDSPRKKDSE